MTLWNPGDLLFFWGTDWISRAIQIGTLGPSHVGIVCQYRDRGPLLCESTTLCDLPDELDDSFRQGMQFHHPEDRISNYNGRVERMGLADGWRLNDAESDALTKWLWRMRHRPYDAKGAILSGTRVFKWTSFMPYPDDGSLFCSELCAAALMRMSPPRLPLSHPGAYNPASLMRAVRRCGTYTKSEPIPTATQEAA